MSEYDDTRDKCEGQTVIMEFDVIIGDGGGDALPTTEDDEVEPITQVTQLTIQPGLHETLDLSVARAPYTVSIADTAIAQIGLIDVTYPVSIASVGEQEEIDVLNAVNIASSPVDAPTI